MPRNVEVKAKIKSFSRTLEIATNLCGTDPEIISQKDTFFNVPYGRLKIRHFQNGSTSQLIYYNRLDIEKPRISEYSICPVENHEALTAVLILALGVVGSVEKTRYLFLCGQTRIHIDRVEGLGDFVELEVVLSPEQTSEEGEDIANRLMQKFEITEKDLIKTAYIDLLFENIKNK